MPYNLKMKKKFYKVFINSKFKTGSLSFGEILIKGKSRRKFFFQHIYVTRLWQIMNYLDHALQLTLPNGYQIKEIKLQL